jgi:hypothetical protein
MKMSLILIQLLLVFQPAIAQTTYHDNISPQRQTTDIFQKLNINQDPRFEELVKLHIRKNQQINGIQGFRVEIFFSSEINARLKAQNIKNEFLSAYPDYNVYISFVSPDFKVKVGDFRTKNDALRLMKEIRGQFPKAFVVPDLIEFPKLF